MSSLFPMHQPSLFEIAEFTQPSTNAFGTTRSGSFVDNMKLPVHRWFRYSAGFSADWVRQLLRDRKPQKQDLLVLDPFAGVGTTLIACDSEKIRSVGYEMHPFVNRIASTKSAAIGVDWQRAREFFEKFFSDVSQKTHAHEITYPPLIHKCYSNEALAKLNSLKATYLFEYSDGSLESELIWLCITSILRVSSGVGTAQWQYILPNKQKSTVMDPLEAFKTKAQQILDDIAYAQRHEWLSVSLILETDSRQPDQPQDEVVDLVITSPPYPNNYDYADATRLEMTFWGEIEGWKDLQPTVRRHLIRSCSQHASAEGLVLHSLLGHDALSPIRDDLARACTELSEIRLTKGGRKAYHTMAAAYFVDMAEVFHALRRICRSDSEMCFVIGDSAPYGVYLNVDEWLGKLAISAGFSSYRFEKIRDRNIKWRNRKHRVPLKEGRLWVQG